MDNPYQQYLTALDHTDKYRRLPATYSTNSKYYLNFATNDYLALSQNPKLIEAAIVAAKEYGIGATGSRLLSGNNPLYEKLEQKIAASKNCEAALVFNSGFQTNSSVLAALLDQTVLKQEPLVFFDKFNHASLYQAVFLSKPQLIRYPHNDYAKLEELLYKFAKDSRPKFIVTETLFGMDGDLISLTKIAALAQKYQAFLYLDEAHATGVFGKHGYGLSTTVDLTNIPHLIMGTFSKALGSSGGYIACSHLIRNYLINKAAGFIYSTAPSPAIIGAALKAWELIATLEKERAQLQNLSTILLLQLKEQGFNIGNSSTQIIPILLKSEDKVLQAKEKLLANKILVSAIRPPTVPLNSSRLRIALTSQHTLGDLELLLKTLVRIK